MSEYQAGGKGQAPRQSDKPSWVGLPIIERSTTTVTFATRTGIKIVPAKQVDDWNRRSK